MKDLNYVKQLPGPKSLRNTEIYNNLNQTFSVKKTTMNAQPEQQRHSRAPRALLEAGFQYVIDMEEFELFR